MPEERHIQRSCATFTATIDLGATVSDKVCCGDYDTGMVYFPAAFTGTSVTFQGSHKTEPCTTDRYPTFATVYDTTPAASSVTYGASRWAPIPTEVMAMGAFKFVSTGGGKPEDAERSLIVCMK